MLDPIFYTPKNKQAADHVIQYKFPQARPIFWGPNQQSPTEGQVYPEPSGWKDNECLIIPKVIRFCHDDGEVDSETADNTGGNPDPGGDPNGWTLYDQACYVSVMMHEYIPPLPAPGCNGGTSHHVLICGPAGCPPGYGDSTPPCPVSPFSLWGGYYQMIPTHTGIQGNSGIYISNTPLWAPNSSFVIIHSQLCVEDPDTSIWDCRKLAEGRTVFGGSVFAAVAAGFMDHFQSITTWFWKKVDGSQPDGYRYTYTQWINNKWIGEYWQQIPNPDFVNMQWCYPGNPIPPNWP